MRVLDFGEIWELGTLLGWISCSDYGEHEVKGKGWLINQLQELMDLIDVCEIEDQMVVGNIEEWIDRLKRKYKVGQKISKKDGEELRDDSERWQDLIYKEICTRPCIEFERGALSQRALVQTSKGKPNSVFERKIWLKLPEIAKSDFSDAAKCLLIGASTPATMVGLRGIESVIRKFYFTKTGKRATGKLLGNIISELENVPKMNKQLLGYLDYIRSEKRNIAQHPTRIFTQKEAERIFMEIVAATHDILA